MLNTAIKNRAAEIANKVDEVVYIVKGVNGQLIIKQERHLTQRDHNFLIATVDPCGMVSWF
jgi:hypothetical protein